MPNPTKYMNSKKRVIMKSHRGAFYVNDGDKKRYGVKAAYKKNAKGNPQKLTVSMANTVPLAIRPASRRGAPYGPRAGKVLRLMFNKK
jgi:hypothetical protein